MKLSTIQKVKDPDLRTRLLAKYTKDHRILKIRETIIACQACVLHEDVKAPVPWSGSIPSPLVFIGDSSAVEEDRFGIPFVG